MALIMQSTILRDSVFLLPAKPRHAGVQAAHRWLNPDLSPGGGTQCSLLLGSPGATAADSSSSPVPSRSDGCQPQPLLTDSTRTITTFALLAYTFVTKLAQKLSLAIPVPSPQFLDVIRCSAGPAFFASLRDRPSGNLNTPLTVVAAGLSKWLDIYSGVLLVRVLLSWFPNIPWERQPLSAIRDLCDPYLNLFRNVIPPVFDTLDISPLFAFAVLGALGSILNTVV